MNTKIIVKNPNTFFPDRLLTDGELVLNLTDSESLSLYNNIYELNDISTLKIGGALNFNIYATELNRQLFIGNFDPNAQCPDIKEYDVEVICDCFVLEYKKLSYNSFDDESNLINVSLDFDESHWINKSKTAKLVDLDFGDKFTFIGENLLDNWENNYWYEDGQKPYYYPLAVYGTTTAKNFSNAETAINPNMYTFSNLRPWLSFIWILRELFCSIGWQLKTSLDETDFLKRLWVYLLKPEFTATDVLDDRGRWLRFAVENVTYKYFGTAPFIIDNTTLDTNGNTGTNYFTKPSEPHKDFSFWANPLMHTIEMKFKITIDVEFSLGGYDFSLIMRTRTKTDSLPVDDEDTFNQEIIVYTETTIIGRKTIVAEATVSVHYGEIVYFYTSLKHDDINYSFGQYYLGFSGEMSTKTYMLGDTVDLKLAVDDYTLEDLFASFLHVINGKFYTDNLTKTIFVYPERKTELYDGSKVNGYYEEVEEDLTDKVIQGSFKHSLVSSNVDRYLTLKFKDSTDPAIAKLKKEKTLHAKTIDYGLKNENTKTLENKLFEPTLDMELYTSESLFTNKGLPIKVPFISDSEERALAYNIKPRILISLGYVEQTQYDIGTKIPISPFGAIFWLHDRPDHLQGNHVAIYQSKIPLVTQSADYFIGLDASIVNANVAFGDKAYDLFYQFYYSYLAYKRNEKISMLVDVSPAYFFSNVFRKIKRILYNGTHIRLAMTGINDFKISEGISTPVDFVPFNLISKKFKCNCQYSECLFYQPWDEVFYPDPSLCEIKSIKIEGVEQLSGSIHLGTLNVITFEAFNYATNMIDAINSAKLDELSASYAIDKEALEEKKRMKIRYLNCLHFEIVVVLTSSGDNLYRWSNTGFNDWDATNLVWKPKYAGSGDPVIKYEPYQCVSINGIKQCQ